MFRTATERVFDGEQSARVVADRILRGDSDSPCIWIASCPTLRADRQICSLAREAMHGSSVAFCQRNRRVQAHTAGQFDKDGPCRARCGAALWNLASGTPNCLRCFDIRLSAAGFVHRADCFGTQPDLRDHFAADLGLRRCRRNEQCCGRVPCRTIWARAANRGSGTQCVRRRLHRHPPGRAGCPRRGGRSPPGRRRSHRAAPGSWCRSACSRHRRLLRWLSPRRSASGLPGLMGECGEQFTGGERRQVLRFLLVVAGVGDDAAGDDDRRRTVRAPVRDRILRARRRSPRAGTPIPPSSSLNDRPRIPMSPNDFQRSRLQPRSVSVTSRSFSRS